jgi:hypothetical protein
MADIISTDYISTSDITDSQLLDTALSTRLSAKITASTAALNDLAESKGVLSGMIQTDPFHTVLKQWCVAWTCAELCFDLMGKNKTDSLENDIYFQKYKEHQSRLEKIELKINYQVLTGTVFTELDRASNTTRIFRS